jgi:hypothetical protein
VLALVMVLIGWAVGAPALGFGGALGIIVGAIVLSLLFILGVWIGDLITAGRDRRRIT